MNYFENWADYDPENETNLLKRSMQLKELIEFKRESALKNIAKAQEKQKKIQNDRTNPTTTELEVGSSVTVKVEGLRGKLENLYRGRYTIRKRTKEGNYKIKNALGEELKESYPINKLKPIEDDVELPTVSAEIEKIINHE